MKRLKKVDYLFYGNGSEILINHIDQHFNICNKSTLLYQLEKKGHLSEYAADIIKGYKGENQSYINIKRFKRDLLKTISLQNYFKTLGCRGFSYYVVDNFDLNCYLNSSINFKLAIIPNKELYYPFLLRNYFPNDPLKWDENHLISNGYPAIAFALGKIVSENLYVCTLQSDLIHRQPSYIREYIKGWRKILFKEILYYIKNRNIKNIFLCTSTDVLKASKPISDSNVLSSSGFELIYDNTASYFNMKYTKLGNLFDIQVLNNSPEIWVKYMYHLRI